MMKGMLGAGLLAVLAGTAQAQMYATGVRTIHLDGDPGAAMPIAYDPGFGYYYGSGGGSPGNPTFVWGGSGGGALQVASIDIDMRAFLYNPNTGGLEACPYGVDSGTYPYSTPDRDGSGFILGSHTSLVGSMPGIKSSQSSPAYDAGRDVLYSRDFGGSVNISRRSDGALVGGVTLDFGAAGMSSEYQYGIGYDPNNDLLLVGDGGPGLDRVHGFRATDGSYVGTTDLDIDNPYPYYNGNFSNGQWFVYDGRGYQGYAISDIPAPGSLALLGLGGLAAARRRRA